MEFFSLLLRIGTNYGNQVFGTLPSPNVSFLCQFVSVQSSRILLITTSDTTYAGKILKTIILICVHNIR